MNKQIKFVTKFYPFAKQAEIDTGINLEYILARHALESGWGLHCPGNMAFGIKADSSWQGERQLLTTHEHFTDDKQGFRFPEVIKIEKKQTDTGQIYYDYTVKDWFRAYDSVADSYIDHTRFYFANSRYAKALCVKSDAKAFAAAVNRAGYSTGKNATKILWSIIDTISGIIQRENLEATCKPK